MVFERFVLSEATLKTPKGIPRNLLAMFSKVSAKGIEPSGDAAGTYAFPVKNLKAVVSGFDKIGIKIKDDSSKTSWDLGEWQIILDKKLPNKNLPNTLKNRKSFQIFKVLKKKGLPKSELARAQGD